MKVKKIKGTQATVDMIPMLDIVFQLVLFFLVSTTFAVLPAISVSLPESSTSKGASVEGITITVEESGAVWFNDAQVTFEALDRELAAFDVGDKAKEEYPVTLEADTLVTNGTIVSIFDILRKNGYSAVNLRTTDK
ncbi:MAG: biopolymer transporter ExbD [Treponema sp.]|nr:biopolymer transporter ExbD [Treponema sp.]